MFTLIHENPDQFCLPPHYGQPHGRCRGTAQSLFPQLPGQLRPWHSDHKHGNPVESLHLRYLHPRSFWVQLINLIQVGKPWNGQSFLYVKIINLALWHRHHHVDVLVESPQVCSTILNNLELRPWILINKEHSLNTYILLF